MPFYVSATDRYVGDAVFLGSPSVRPCVRECVPKSSIARYLTNQETEFNQTLVIGVVEAKDELIRF